jgi:hypothetical protein
MPGRTELLQRENHHSGRITFVYFPPKNPSGAPIFREESGISESSPVLATIPAQFSSTDCLVLNQRFARGHSQHPRERSQIRDGQVLKVPESLAVGWEQKKLVPSLETAGHPLARVSSSEHPMTPAKRLAGCKPPEFLLNRDSPYPLEKQVADRSEFPKPRTQRWPRLRYSWAGWF